MSDYIVRPVWVLGRSADGDQDCESYPCAAAAAAVHRRPPDAWGVYRQDRNRHDVWVEDHPTQRSAEGHVDRLRMAADELFR